MMAGGDDPADVTLNFAGADIRDVINAVLGKTLKLNYVIDPEVTGPVTFNVSRPISRNEVLSTLGEAVNSRGATMVQSDGIIRVMPLRKDGKSDAAAPARAGASGGGRARDSAPSVSACALFGATDMQHVLEKVLLAGVPIASTTRNPPGGDAQGTPSEIQPRRRYRRRLWISISSPGYRSRSCR